MQLKGSVEVLVTDIPSVHCLLNFRVDILSGQDESFEFRVRALKEEV